MTPISGDFGALAGGDEEPPRPPPYPDVGSGKRIIYSNSQQQVWLIDEQERLVDTYLVSGRKGIPYIGTYTVFSKSVNAWAPYGGITMKHMVRFVRPGTWGNRWSYGFHSIPRYPNGQPMQTEDELGYFRSGGLRSPGRPQGLRPVSVGGHRNRGPRDSVNGRRSSVHGPRSSPANGWAPTVDP